MEYRWLNYICLLSLLLKSIHEPKLFVFFERTAGMSMEHVYTSLFSHFVLEMFQLVWIVNKTVTDVVLWHSVLISWKIAIDEKILAQYIYIYIYIYIHIHIHIHMGSILYGALYGRWYMGSIHDWNWTVEQLHIRISSS